VLSTEEETDTVKTMFLHPNTSYTHPTRLDILQVARHDILLKVDLCTAMGRAYTFRAQENDKIDKKHASFHK
jgi:hypothetical protein